MGVFLCRIIHRKDQPFFLFLPSEVMPWSTFSIASWEVRDLDPLAASAYIALTRIPRKGKFNTIWHNNRFKYTNTSRIPRTTFVAPNSFIYPVFRKWYIPIIDSSMPATFHSTKSIRYNPRLFFSFVTYSCLQCSHKVRTRRWAKCKRKCRSDNFWIYFQINKTGNGSSSCVGVQCRKH